MSVLDAAAYGLGRSVPASCTSRTPLLGAEGYQALWNRRRLLADDSGLHVARVEHLLGRYGSLIGEVLALVSENPDLGQPLPGAEDYLRAEVVHAVSHEGARHLDDVLTRRTRISIETFDRGVGSARPAAELMAGELGWDQARLDDEVDHYLRRVEAERQSQREPTDRAADEARVRAPDIV